MKKEIKIPDIAENVESGIVGGILVSEGDEVSKDQSLLEIETDKAATDIPSPYDGKVDKIMVNEGDEVSVDQVVMVLETSDGEASGDEGDDGDEKDEKEASGNGKTEEKEASGEEEEDEQSEEQDEDQDEDQEENRDEEDETEKRQSSTDSQQSSEDSGKSSEEDQEQESADQGKASKTSDRPGEDIPASPAVRRKAREAGVDLSKIEGTGPGDRITPEDVEKAKKQGKAPEGKEKRSRGEDAEMPDFSEWGATEKKKMNTVRRITARTMTQSWKEIPQVTQFDEADITDIEAFRQKNKDAFEKDGGKLTMTAMLVKISAFALQKFPRFNSSIDTSDDTLIMKKYYNIGLAVDTDKGLMVPVVKDADQKSLLDISKETVELAGKARGNEISPDEMKGGNFTISNLGGIGGTAFTPIVYSPQVAILGMSRATYKQVYREDEFQKRLVLPLTLTYDHRVIDGADGARFLKWICDVLEDPYALMR